MPTQADYLNLSQASYTSGGNSPVVLPGWSIIKTATDNYTGMQGVAFKNNSTGEVVVSYEGTNLSNLGQNQSFINAQLAADAAIAAGNTPQANRAALSFAKDVADSAKGAPIFVTGHSLGGEEAQYVVANAAGSGLTIVGGATFGAPGVPNQTTVNGNVNLVNYVDYGDQIGSFTPNGGAHIGRVQFIGSQLDQVAENTLLGSAMVMTVSGNPATAGGLVAAAAGMMVGDHLLGNYAGASLTLSGTSDTIRQAGDDTLIINGTATKDTVMVSGTDDRDTLSGGIVTMSNNAHLTLNGSSDTIKGGYNDTLKLSGTNDIALLSNGRVNEAANSSLTLLGTSDAVSQASNDTLTISGTATKDTVTVSGTGDNDVLSGGTVTMNNNASLTLSGSSDTINGGYNDTLSISGTNDTASLS